MICASARPCPGMAGAISYNSQRYEKRTGWYSIYYYYPRITDNGVHKGAGDSFMVDSKFLEEYNKENECLETIWSLDERFRKEIKEARGKGMDWNKFFRTRFLRGGSGLKGAVYREDHGSCNEYKNSVALARFFVFVAAAKIPAAAL